MIKELLALTSCVAFIGAGSITPTRNYQHTEDVGNTQVTYKYETNEVYSIDDLIVGNIYHFDIPLASYDEIPVTTTIMQVKAFYNFKNYDGLYSTFVEDDFISLYIGGSSNLYLYTVHGSNYITYLSHTYFEDNVTFDFVCFSKTGYITNLISYISSTDFNVIESVNYESPTTIVGVINDFTTQYLFKDIPYVNDIKFTIGGQEITLMTWLVLVFGLITAVGLFVLLFFVFRALFRLFSNTFKSFK